MRPLREVREVVHEDDQREGMGAVVFLVCCLLVYAIAWVL